MSKEKIVLVNDLSPGDVLLMSIAIRSLHKAFRDRFAVGVRSPSNEIFENNPYVDSSVFQNTPEASKAIEELKKDEHHPAIMVGDTKYVISHYPEIHRSGMTGLPFCDGHRMFLQKQLDVTIPRTGMKPDIFFSREELARPHKVEGRYWIVNAGIKNDYTLKWYNHYQEVIDLLKDKIQFVQVGHSAHNHPPLNNVIDMRGKTNLRELFLLSRYADGAVCAVSLQMVIMAALSKPCVVIAGAREGVRWQLNPDHRFLYRNGVMSCAPYDGCWKSRIEDCVNKTKDNQPLCLELIAPEEVARAVELYYLGGKLKPTLKQLNLVDPYQKKGEEKVKPHREAVETVEAPRKYAEIVLEEMVNTDQVTTSAILNTLRILKKNNQDDRYYEAYLGHFGKRKDKFMDVYHFMWFLGANYKPKRILEIGCRNGASICQLLSAYTNYDVIEKIVLCDTFTEFGTQESVLKNLEYLNIPFDKGIEFIKGDSLIEIPNLKGSFDYILVDGCHEKSFAAQDLINAAEILEIGGFILFDDITPDGCSLQDVWDKFKESFKEKFQFSENHEGKGIGVARRFK